MAKRSAAMFSLGMAALRLAMAPNPKTRVGRRIRARELRGPRGCRLLLVYLFVESGQIEQHRFEAPIVFVRRQLRLRLA